MYVDKGYDRLGCLDILEFFDVHFTYISGERGCKAAIFQFAYGGIKGCFGGDIIGFCLFVGAGGDGLFPV